MGRNVLDNLGDQADNLVGQVGDLVDNHLDQLGGVAESYINAKVNRGAKKASAYVKKKGGGVSSSFQKGPMDPFRLAKMIGGDYNPKMSAAQYNDQQRFMQGALRQAKRQGQRMSIGGKNMNMLARLGQTKRYK